MLKKISLLLLFWQSCIVLVAWGKIIHVPNDEVTIQAGIFAAIDGDTVLVAPGVYYENINFFGKNIVVASHYILNFDPILIDSTIINGSQPAHLDTASCVLIVSGEDSTAILEGFTLTGGRGTIWKDIHYNLNYREGGGILVELSSPTIRNNHIINNQATNLSNVTSAGGGGIRCGDGNPMIISNVIKGNKGRYGAGIVMNFATGTIKNNIIVDNSGGEDYGGSGIWLYAVGPTIIENNTIVNNTAILRRNGPPQSGKGGGILVWSTYVNAQNNIIWKNTPTDQQIYLESASGTLTYNDIQGGWTGTGNINENPMVINDSYLLMPNSPCVDMGNPDSNYNDPEDFINPGTAAFPSRGTIRNDIGAYGGPNRNNLIATPTPIIKQKNHTTIVGYYLAQNYPNPFNATTLIQYTIPKFDRVTIKVYDLNGQEVATLVDQHQNPGVHEIIFDAKNLSSGCYFVTIKTGNFSDTKKAILLH